MVWTPNEAGVMTFAYHVRGRLPGSAKLTITTRRGVPVRRLTGPAEAGLRRVVWDGRDENRAPVPVGDYDVTAEAGGTSARRVATLRPRRD